MKCYISLLLILIPVFVSSQGRVGYVVDDVNTDSIRSFILLRDGTAFSCFGESFNGFLTDYYDTENSKKRLSGRFKGGIPIDTVKGYYENGDIKFIYYPYKRKYEHGGRKYNYCLYMEYDEQGDCVNYIDDKKGVELKYGKDKALLSVLYYHRKKSSVKYYAEYFPGSKKRIIVTRRNKYEYDERERLRRHWVRKSEQYDKKYGTMSATFYYEEYNVSGKMTVSGRFYSNLQEHDNWFHITPEFPASLDSVPLQDFKEVINHQLNIKDVYRWDYNNNKIIITRHEQKGNIWIETDRKVVPRITVSNN